MKDKILILGGTQFIGRNLVEKLSENNSYDLTLFNRQRTKSDLFPEIKKLKGDRETNDIKQISKENWDYVIDLSCYYPDSLRQVLTSVNKDLKKYIFISTCSVYDGTKDQTALSDEDSMILSCSEEQQTDRTPSTYGNRKVACEQILRSSGFEHIIFRPSLVYGRYDHTDRFYYWLHQVKNNSPLLLPDNGERVCSMTYVHDLVTAIIKGIEIDTGPNTFNVISATKLSIKKIIDETGKILGKDFKIINAEPEFLRENNISQWTDMPLWLDGDHFTYSNKRLTDQLNIQPVPFIQSLQETIAYYESLGWPDPEYGMTEEKRMELIFNIKEK